MEVGRETANGVPCRAVVMWIDWYAYHLARFSGLQSAFGRNGEVRGVEFVGGVGVHKGLNFREGRSADLPVETLFPTESWHGVSKWDLSLAILGRLTSLNPEIVLVPGYYTLPAVVAALWCKFKGRISVLMTESTAADHARKGWREALKSRLIRFLFDWAVTGGAAHDRYLLQLGFPKDRIAHFYDVVGNTEIANDVEVYRAGATASEEGLPSRYFLFVGRLAPEKNVAGLLRAWIAYRAAGGAWPLVLAGDGPEAESLRAMAAASGAAADVHFLGHRSARELLPAYAFAGAFVLPSTREPWGLVVNEAMAAALPVIVSNRCGCAEDLVATGENGLVFDPAHDHELAHCLSRVSSLSETERARWGQKSSERIARFSPRNFGREIAAIADTRSGGSHRRAIAQPANGTAPTWQRREDALTKRESTASTEAESWLQVLPHLDPKYGGLSAVVPRLAGQLAAQEEIHTSIAAFCAPDEDEASASKQSTRLSRWPLGRSPWMLQPELRERFQAEVASSRGVHIHGIWESSTLLAAAAARRSGVPYILSAHGMLERWAVANKRLKKAVYAGLFEHRNVREATCLHALTRAEADDYRRFGCKGPIAVIPNGVEAPASANPDAFLARFPQARGKRLVLFLGRIHFKKGIDLLIQAWSSLAAQYPDALLILAGPDSENTLAGAIATIEQLGLRDRVLSTGMLEADLKWSALAAADFFILPSFSEGLSVAALEAMSMGVPLILSEQCNLPQIEQAGAGWLVKTDAADVARALLAALQSTPEQHRAMSASARALAKKEFDWASVTERMAQLYRWVNGGAFPRDVEVLRGTA